MGRIRAIKPGFFTDAELYDAELESGMPLRVAFAGLWTVADREGRFAWKPREIKTHILPYDNLDMEAVLTALARHGFIFKYKCAGYEYGFIPKFAEHQHVNKNEAASTIPEPPKNSNARARRVNARAEQDDNNNARELTEINPVLLVVGNRKGREGEESISSDRFASDPIHPKPNGHSPEPKKRRKHTYSEPFLAFWREYPTDPIMSKIEAATEFSRLSDEDQRAATLACSPFKTYCAQNPDYRPIHAVRFLRQRRFDGLAAGGLTAGMSEAQRALAALKQPDGVA